MIKIPVKLGNRSHEIIIENGLLNLLWKFLPKKIDGQKWIIISQKTLIENYGSKFNILLNEKGYESNIIEISDSEQAKSYHEYQSIIDRMIKLGCDRSTVILAVGGGVVGDISGFVAATFMRGIDYYQIPTTLLSMVDSSIGGKTGINLDAGKNLVGSIHQPRGIFIDPELLATLPREEIVSGLGEILKYGAIYDKEFLSSISRWLDEIESFPFNEAIKRSCEIKAEVVSEDENEEGRRRILNFGHTIGHALEAHSGYGKIRHGEAIAYGMICSGWISNQIGLLSDEETSFLKESILKLPLPQLDELNYKSILGFIKSDKKYQSGILHFVVLNGLGNAIISNKITEELIVNSLKEIQ